MLGHSPSQADTVVFEGLRQAPPPSLPHASRWYRHIASFSKEERLSFPGKKVSLEELTGRNQKVL